MNKLCFRVVFNRHRGMLMAVQETAASDTGSSSGSGPSRRETRSSRPSFKGFALSPVLKASALAWALALGTGTSAFAQTSPPSVQASPMAPAGQRPIVDATANGVPLVHTFAAFRASNCSGMTITACDALVQQAMDARTKRAGSLMALGAVVEAGASRLGSIKFTKPQGSYTNALPVQRIVFNGIELEPGLPPPVAGYDYSPTTVPRATTDNVLWSHWTGFQAEISLANSVASTGQVVVKWGAPIGQRGSDVISVIPVTGEVYLWDSKYRSTPVKIGESPTFSQRPTREQAIQEATDAIFESDIDPATKSRALENIRRGNFTTNTAGAGAAKNSVQTRYCGFNPC